MQKTIKIAVVIPAYRVKKQIMSVLLDIGPECDLIFVVDDACPEQVGRFVEENSSDKRVHIIRHDQNMGVGGAVVSGYRRALDAGADIIVKIDGDGQMDPRLIKSFVAPIVSGKADYTKGNRFHSFYSVRSMPKMRLLGNAVLSFMTKLSSGYWRMFDPTNGFTAIHKSALKKIDLGRLSKRYFFETDMLISLGDIRAKIIDVMMEAKYGDEESGLKIRTVTFDFLWKHTRSTFRRLIYSYFLRDFSLASMNLLLGTLLFGFGFLFGGYSWYLSVTTGTLASTGTVMLAVLPLILGVQLILFFFSLDIANEPGETIQSQMLEDWEIDPAKGTEDGKAE